MKYKMATYELYALAVVAFLVDHVGVTLFPTAQNPDFIWFRVFRLFALVWFFPLGYITGWRSPPRVWLGLAVMTLVTFITANEIFPLCALATILAVRPLMEPLMGFAMKSQARFWAVQAGILLLLFPVKHVMEYGAMAAMIATAGWLVRHRDRLPPGIINPAHYMVFMTAIYLAYAQWVFHFPPAPAIFVIASTALTAWQLLHFTSMVTEDLSRQRRKMSGFQKLCRWTAHHTLEIYVISFVILRIVAAIIAFHPPAP